MTEQNLLVEKWDKLLSYKSKRVESLTENDERLQVATLLENQENWLTENTNSASDLGVFTPFLVPTVRRIFPSLVANQIVGIQPMSAPTGYAFAWRATYSGTNTNPAGAAVKPLHRGTLTASEGQWQSVVLIVPTGTVITIGDDVRDTTGGGGNIAAVVVYTEDTDGSARALVEYVMAGDTISYPIAAGDSIWFEAADSVEIVVASIINNESAYNLVLRNYVGPYTTAAGEILSDDMPSMRVHMERASVEAKTRKLKAEYTLEMAQDLKAVHNMDAESELINHLQYEIAQEIDRTLVAAINDNSTPLTAWSYGVLGDSQTDTAGFADGQWEIEKLRTIYSRILKEANRVAITTRRGPANFILASVNVVSALETLNNFMYAPAPNNLGPVGGVTQVGNLDGRFTVFVDTFAEADYCTVGYKGPGTMESGVIYCPYVPIIMQKITHEKTFQPAIGVMTRSAIAFNMLGTANYYRRFVCDFTKSQFA